MVEFFPIATSDFGNPHTAAGQWTATQNHKLARSPDGTLWVAFGDETVAPAPLKIFKSVDEGETWTLDATFDPAIANYRATSANVMVSNDSIPHVVFAYENTFFNGDLKVYHSQRGPSGWTGIELIINQNTPNHRGHYLSACLDHLGFIHLVFLFWPTTSSFGRSARYWTNESGSWVETVLKNWSGLSADPFISYASIASDSVGDLHIAYAQALLTPDNETKWKYARKASGVAWGNLITGGELFDSIVGVSAQDYINNLSIYADAGGTAHIAWKRHTAGFSENGIAYVSRSGSGLSAIEQVIPQQTSAQPTYTPSVFVTTTGDVYISYGSTQPVTFRSPIYVVKRTGPGVFAEQYSLDETNGQDGVYLLGQAIPYIGFSSGVPKFGWCGVYVKYNSPSLTETIYFVKSDDLEFSDGSELTPEGPPAYDASTSFLSVVLQGEGSPVAIYPFVPDFAFLTDHRYLVNRKRSEGGWETTWPERTRKRRLWSVGHETLTQAQAETLASFLDSVKGPVSTFWFQVPEPSESVAAHLVQVIVPISKANPGVYRVEMVFEEIFP